ncbi:MAB_1171c family putative transporter [Streptomyces sp. NPDC020412]|uniref:MAB_1171c family putative transporter n=1 Tax=Streptomyces sp. NPDC020412 TaxID=3365073 RepID=UPI00378A4DA5
MNYYLYPTCSLFVFLALAYKVRVLRSDRSPAQVFLVANLFFLGFTFFVSTPPVWVAISDTVGVANFSGLLSQASVIMNAACQQILLLHLLYDRRKAWRKAFPRIVALTFIVIAMAAFFAASNVSHESPSEFALSKAQYYPLYLAVYLLGFTANQIDVALLGWRSAKVAPTPWLRRGMLLIALVLPFTMVYTGCRAAAILAGSFGRSGQDWEFVAQVSVSIATVISTAGWTIPDWGRHLDSARNWWRDLVAFRQLRPLHQELTSHAPQVVLTLGSGADLRTRLYRLVVETRDAQWALRAWVPEGATSAACSWAEEQGLQGTEKAALVEAMQLRAALDHKSQGKPPAATPQTNLMAEPQNLAAEITFQRRLVQAFAHAPNPETFFPASEQSR